MSTRIRAIKSESIKSVRDAALAGNAQPLLDELMGATTIAATVCRAMESSEEHAEECHALRQAVDRLYRIHSDMEYAIREADMTALASARSGS